MTAPIHYSGQLAPSAPPHPPGFTVHAELTFANMADAKAFGDWLHKVLISKIAAEGGQLTPWSAKAVTPVPVILRA